MAKTDWTLNDEVKPEDMNQIGQEINANAGAAEQAQQAAGTAQSTADDAKQTVEDHIANKDNPHGTTKEHVGLGNVDNVRQATKLEFDSHKDNKNNPHGVTKAQVGLGNVDNVKQATKTEFDTHVDDYRAHGATYENEPSAIMRRDSLGRASVSNPTQNEHITNKSYVDSLVNNSTSPENVTVISPINRNVSGAEYPYGVTMFNFVASHGYPYSQGTALNINDPNPYRFTQIVTQSSQSSNQAGRTSIRVWREDSGWSPFRELLDDVNLPDPARLDRSNTFKSTQVIELDNTGNMTAQRLISTGVGSDFGWSLRADGRISLWDYKTGETIIVFGNGKVETYAETDYVIGGSLTVGGKPVAVQDGNYANLRARGTTKADVGLSNVTNHAQWHNDNNPVQFAENGYQILANGLIIQWGRIPNVNPGSTSKSGTFPIAFPNVTYQAYATVEADEPSYANVGFLTKTGLQVWLEADQPRSVRWLAIGR